MSNMISRDLIKRYEKIIIKILPADNQSVNEESQRVFYNHLENKLKKLIELTGTEDFAWEEKYILGGWSRTEYEELKKTNPSFTDKFLFIKLSEKIANRQGIIIKVQRISDNKLFFIPLADLKCFDKNNENSELVDAYSFWMTNYR
jgi:hypothetical protein